MVIQFVHWAVFWYEISSNRLIDSSKDVGYRFDYLAVCSKQLLWELFSV